MSQTPITVTYTLEEILKQINQKLDKLDDKVDHLTVEVTTIKAKFEGEVTTIKTKLEGLESDITELKTTQKNQIWSLITLAFTAVLGLTGAIAKILFFPNP